MAVKKAIVIGAGIVGLATARALALNNFSVKIFERYSRAVGASVRNFGMIWPIGQADDFYDIAIRTREIWKELANTNAFSIQQNGSLHLAYHSDELKVLGEVYSSYQSDRDLKLLNTSDTRSISPAARMEGLKGSLYSPNECVVDPSEAIAGVSSYLNSLPGVDIMWNTSVNRVMPNKIITADGNIFEADLVFICSGSDFETLYPQLYTKEAITKCKLQMLRIASQESWNIGPSICGGLSLIHYKSFAVASSLAELRSRYESELPDYIENGIHVMVAQNSKGELIIGDSHEYGITPDPFEKETINKLILSYLANFGTFRKNDIVNTWTGTYAKRTDGSNYLFLSPEAGVYVFNGLGGNGMTLSFGLAEQLVSTL